MQLLDSHDEQLKLAEFTLGTISTSLQMFSDSSMKASVRLAACLLDDKRPRIKMVTPRYEGHTHMGTVYIHTSLNTFTHIQSVHIQSEMSTFVRSQIKSLKKWQQANISLNISQSFFLSLIICDIYTLALSSPLYPSWLTHLI